MAPPGLSCSKSGPILAKSPSYQSNAVGAIASGAVRSALGPAGFTANLITLVVAYAFAGLLTWRFFAGHEPAGDIGVPTLTVPDSRA